MSAWSPTYSQVVSRDETISYAGGSRARFLYDSLYVVLKSGLQALGWLNPTIYDTPPGNRKNHPVNLLTKQLSWEEKITPNTIAFIPENNRSEYAEVGSELFEENKWIFYLDIFGESEAVSLQLALDMIDILKGKFSMIGRTNGPTVDICDTAQSGHYKIGYVILSNLTSDRAPNYTQRWQQFLRVVRFEASDWYGDDTDLGVGRGHWAFTP
jgi:hypothetical protein